MYRVCVSEHDCSFIAHAIKIAAGHDTPLGPISYIRTFLFNFSHFRGFCSPLFHTMVNQLESTVSFLPVHGFVCKMAFFYFYISRFQEISVILVSAQKMTNYSMQFI
jgi:hypothetical protein